MRIDQKARQELLDMLTLPALAGVAVFIGIAAGLIYMDVWVL